MKSKKPWNKAGAKPAQEGVSKVSKKRVAAWGAFVQTAYRDEDKANGRKR